MNQFGESDSVEPVYQNQSYESAGRGPDATSSLTNGLGRSDETAPEPRFGISHMMVWIACCGVYMGAMRLTWPEAIGQSFSGFLVISAGLNSLSGGAFLAGILLFAVRRFRGATYPLHAGEWLLTLGGVQLAADLAYSAAAQLATSHSPVALGVSMLITASLFLWPALRARDPRRWKVFFWSALLINLSHGLFQLMWVASLIVIEAMNLLPVLLAAFLMGCVWMDRQVPLRRPWSHWAGVMAFLWSTLVHAVTMCLFALKYQFGWDWGRM